MMEVFRGRPAEERIEKEQRTYDFLDAAGIEYFRCDHPSADTIEQCAPVEQTLGAEICKNLFLTNRQHTAFYLLAMPGDKPFKTKELSSQLGTARLSFGTGEEMERLINITPGSVSLMGLIFDAEKQIHLVLDRDLLKQEYFCCHPCINTSTVKMKTADLLEKFLPAAGYEPTFVDLVGAE